MFLPPIWFILFFGYFQFLFRISGSPSSPVLFFSLFFLFFFTNDRNFLSFFCLWTMLHRLGYRVFTVFFSFGYLIFLLLLFFLSLNLIGKNEQKGVCFFCRFPRYNLISSGPCGLLLLPLGAFRLIFYWKSLPESFRSIHGRFLLVLRSIDVRFEAFFIFCSTTSKENEHTEVLTEETWKKNGDFVVVVVFFQKKWRMKRNTNQMNYKDVPDSLGSLWWILIGSFHFDGTFTFSPVSEALFISFIPPNITQAQLNPVKSSKTQ